MCLAQGHNAVTRGRLEPLASRSRLKHSTTEPLGSTKVDPSIHRALTHLIGCGARALGIGNINGVLTKIGKIFIIFIYEVSIARLIPI